MNRLTGAVLIGSETVGPREAPAQSPLSGEPARSTGITEQRIRGSYDNDALLGTDEADRINGFQGADFLYGYDGDDVLIGGEGRDLLVGDLGDDQIQGGIGTDTAIVDLDMDGFTGARDYDASGFRPGVVNIVDDGSGGQDTLASVERLRIFGTVGDNVIIGTRSNDIIGSSGGDDTLSGGAGADYVSVSGGGVSFLNGQQGDDNLQVTGAQGAGHVSLAGGAGRDAGRIVFSFTMQDSLDIRLTGTRLTAKDSNGHVYAEGGGIERLVAVGGAGDDVMQGGADNDELDGGAGADRLMGGAGDDMLGGGDDTGGGGGAANDTLIGGEGRDYYLVRTNYFLEPTILDFSDFDASGGDVSVADPYGGTDRIIGIEGVAVFADGINHQSIRDEITGSDGDDWLSGGNGADILKGGRGSDVLFGGDGYDTMIGGSGSDTFVYFDYDLFSMFSSEQIYDLGDNDWIDLSQIDANQLVYGDQAFVIVEAFSGAAGEMVISVADSGSYTLLGFDVTGDGDYDGSIMLDDPHADFRNFVL